MNFEKKLTSRPTKDIYKDGDYVIKVFDNTYQKSDVLNEALNHARVEETGLRIPKIEEVSKVEGKWAITAEYIDGETLSSLMEKNPDKLEQYMEQFVDLQLDIHGKRSPLLNKLKDKLIRQIQELPSIDATTKYELLTRLDSMPKHVKVCHGDFNPSNVIISKNGSYILDWSHATQGNASADAALSYLLFSLQSQDTADLYLNIFCKKCDTARQYVQQWIPIVAAAQLLKKKPEEKDILMKWIDILDYQ